MGQAVEIGAPNPPGSAILFVMPIADLQQAAQKIAGFLASLNKLGGMRLKYRITAGDGARDPEGLEGRVIYVGVWVGPTCHCLHSKMANCCAPSKQQYVLNQATGT